MPDRNSLQCASRYTAIKRLKKNGQINESQSELKKKEKKIFCPFVNYFKNQKKKKNIVTHCRLHGGKSTMSLRRNVLSVVKYQLICLCVILTKEIPVFSSLLISNIH